MPDRPLLNFPSIQPWDTTLRPGQPPSGNPQAQGLGATLYTAFISLPGGGVIAVSSEIAQQVAAQTGGTIGEFRRVSGNDTRNVYRNTRDAVNAARRSMQTQTPVELPPSDSGFSLGGLFSDPTMLLVGALFVMVLLIPRD